MSITQYMLSWDSYKSNICDGFTNLQQNEELVDMTLAADGHLVKVHKSIFALASPYIKSILQSTPNNHPILFLSNISHEILNYILTYVYTGEVSVEVDKIQLFMRVAKDLQLCGLFGGPTPMVNSKTFMKREPNAQNVEENVSVPETSAEDRITYNPIFIDNVSAPEPALTNIELFNTTVSANPVTITNMENVNSYPTSSSEINNFKEPDFMAKDDMQNNSGLYMTADGYQFKLEIQHPNPTTIVENTSSNPTDLIQACNSTNAAVASINFNSNFESFEDEFKNKISAESLDPKAFTLQYTMSTRGSLQLILNRYMYHCHHQSLEGRKRRWRCIDYRNKHCPAFIDTDCEIMSSRKFGHCHSFHDDKIRKKMKRDLIFTSLNVLLEKKKQIAKQKSDEFGLL